MAIPFSFTQKRNFTPPYPEDFAIFVDRKRYSFYSEKIAVFSPKINQLFICDPTLTSIQYPHLDTKNQFKEVEKLINGGEIVINNENFDFLLKAADFFENETLLSSISQFLISSSNSKIFSRLNQNHPVKFIRKELEYIAGKFQAFIKTDEICSLPLEYYDVIFNSPSFNFSDEHALFQWVTKMVESHEIDFTPLYSHINFDILTQDEIQSFLNHVNISTINGSLLYSVKSRLTKAASKDEKDEIEYTNKVVDVPPYLQIQSKEFPYLINEEGSYFKGIFNYLSKDGNPQFRGYVTMDTPSTRKKKYLHKLINFNEESYFNWNNYDGTTHKKETQWLIIRFLIYKVRLDDYTLYVDKDKPNFSQMKHWKVLGSNDGTNWNLIDEEDTDVLNKPHSYYTFECKGINKAFYSYFKIEQLSNFSTKKDSMYEMALSKVEFFGEVRKL